MLRESTLCLDWAFQYFNILHVYCRTTGLAVLRKLTPHKTIKQMPAVIIRHVRTDVFCIILGKSVTRVKKRWLALSSGIAS